MKTIAKTALLSAFESDIEDGYAYWPEKPEWITSYSEKGEWSVKVYEPVWETPFGNSTFMLYRRLTELIQQIETEIYEKYEEIYQEELVCIEIYATVVKRNGIRQICYSFQDETINY
jgi:hypothetical protein